MSDHSEIGSIRLLLFLILPLLLFFVGCGFAKGQVNVVERNSDTLAILYPVIPNPQEISYGFGEFRFDQFHIQSEMEFPEIDMLTEFFESQGISPGSAGLSIEFIFQPERWRAQPEGYSLSINEEGVILTAGTTAGFFYGIQTLKQIIRQDAKGGRLPEVALTDWPAFPIRGFMHDTGRNFQPLSQLKEQLEWLARYKYNVFHWHVTDNPGWRLESKKYPELQAAKSFSRSPEFYTQEEFLELLEFCRVRHITVIPEFDIPGHTEAFRRAFGFERMDDPRAVEVLMDLFQELTTMADAAHMPYIHIGTDEVRSAAEHMAPENLKRIMQYLKEQGREVLVWQEGMDFTNDSTLIQQLWAMHEPKPGRRYIDSRANYINHLDPLAGMVRLFFQQPTRHPGTTDLALGGILCAWPDNRVGDPRDILRQNPIYPAMVFYADAIWKGRERNQLEHWARLPAIGSPEFNRFKEFEQQVIRHRELFFSGLEFPYVAQSGLHWQLLGPLDHEGEVEKIFPIEDAMQEEYRIGDTRFTWSEPVAGGTMHLKHFFGFPAYTEVEQGTYYARTYIYTPEDRLQDFWIGFHGWSRSGGRRGGPFPQQGEWHHTHPKIWVNGMAVAPPIWQQPALEANSEEIPFVDEDYFYRPAQQIYLKAGWNSVLIKIPHNLNSWKWMFTCVPLEQTETGVREAADLLFKPDFEEVSQKN